MLHLQVYDLKSGLRLLQNNRYFYFKVVAPCNGFETAELGGEWVGVNRGNGGYLLLSALHKTTQASTRLLSWHSTVGQSLKTRIKNVYEQQKNHQLQVVPPQHVQCSLLQILPHVPSHLPKRFKVKSSFWSNNWPASQKSTWRKRQNRGYNQVSTRARTHDIKKLAFSSC